MLPAKEDYLALAKSAARNPRWQLGVRAAAIARFPDGARFRLPRTYLGHEGSVLCAAFSPDGALLATAGNDRAVRIWDLASGEQLMICLGHEAWIKSIAFFSDSARVASLDERGFVYIFRARTGEPLSALTAKGGKAIAALPGEDSVVVALEEGTLEISGARRARHRVEEAGLRELAFSPSGKYFASAVGSTIKIFDAATGERVRDVADDTFRDTTDYESYAFFADAWEPYENDPHKTNVRRLRVDDQGELGFELTIETPRWDTSWVQAIAYGPRGMIAAGCFDGTVAVYDADRGREIFCARGNGWGVAALAKSGEVIATAHERGPVRVWDRGSFGDFEILSIALAGEVLVAGGYRGDVVRVELGSGAVTKLAGSGKSVRGVAIDPLRGTVYAVNDVGHLRWWGATTGYCEENPEGYASLAIAFSPRGDRFATASCSDHVRVWSSELRTEIRALTAGGRPRSLAFSPDGRNIAATVEAKLMIWGENFNPRTVAVQDVLSGVAFDESGRRLVTGSSSGDVRVWDFESLRELHRIPAHFGPVEAVAFAGGSRVISGGRDGAIVVSEI